jgi:hypothetical protein
MVMLCKEKSEYTDSTRATWVECLTSLGPVRDWDACYCGRSPHCIRSSSALAVPSPISRRWLRMPVRQASALTGLDVGSVSSAAQYTIEEQPQQVNRWIHDKRVMFEQASVVCKSSALCSRRRCTLTNLPGHLTRPPQVLRSSLEPGDGATGPFSVRYY